MKNDCTIKRLADLVGATIHGDIAVSIDSIAPLDQAGPGQLSFAVKPSFKKQLEQTQASVVVLSEELLPYCPSAALVVRQPELAFAVIAALFLPPMTVPQTLIAHSAVIADSATLDPTVIVGAHCVIGEDVTIAAHTRIMPGTIIGDRCQIGSDSVLHSRVTLYNDVTLGDRVVIDSGVVIGADGFGLVLNEGKWHHMPQLGGVTLGDDVHIGANTTIDCGALNDTVIDDGVKIDNLVQIAHNVHIGAHTAIAACTAIAGSTTIGKHCMIAGGCCISDHVTFTDGVILTGMAGTAQDIDKPGVYSSGTGLFDGLSWRKAIVRFQQINDWVTRIKLLEKKQHERDGQ